MIPRIARYFKSNRYAKGVRGHSMDLPGDPKPEVFITKSVFRDQGLALHIISKIQFSYHEQKKSSTFNRNVNGTQKMSQAEEVQTRAAVPFEALNYNKWAKSS